MVELPSKYLAKTGAGSTKKALIRVLHVDDEASFVKAAKKILEMQGSFQVETVLSVKEALKKIKNREYDVIVSDYQMPERNGLDLLKELRDRGNDVPFILFTGKGREEVAIKALNLGADLYLNKIGHPEVVYSELAHAIEKAVERSKAEKKIVESEAKYRNLVENSKDAIVLVDFKGNVLFGNKAAEKLTGYTVEEGIGMNIREITPKRLWPKSIATLLKARMGKPIPYFECELIRKDGTTIPVETGGQAIFKNGKPVAIQIITRDITERKKAEKKLRESEKQYKTLVENSDQAILVYQDNSYKFANEKAVEISGYSKKELLSVKPLDLVHPKDLGIVTKIEHQIVQARRAGKSPQTYTFRFISKDGKIKWVNLKSVGIMWDDKPAGLNLFTDITERKKAEEKLSHEVALMQTLFEHHPDFIFFKDKNARYQRVSKRFYDFFGLKEKDIIGKTALELFPEETGKQSFSADMQVIKTGKPVFNREGSALGTWILTTKIPWVDKKGKIIGVLGISRDITRLKKVENALRESEEKFRNLAEHSPNMIFINQKGRILYANKKCEELMGYKREEFYSPDFDFFALISPESVNLIKSSFTKHMKGEEVHPYEYSLITKEGKRIEAILTTKLITYEGHRAILGTVTDITERKRAEEIRRQSEQRFRRFFENAPDYLYVVSSEGKILDINNSALETLGYNKEEVIGKPLLSTIYSPSSQKTAKKLFKHWKSGGKIRNEELYIFTKNGETRTVLLSVDSVKDAEGRLLNSVSIQRDITERKKAEKRLKESEERLSQLIENAPDVIYVTDLEGNFVHGNKKSENLTGYKREELSGKNMLKVGLFPEKYIPKIAESLEENRRGKRGGPIEFELIRKDGSTVFAEASSFPVKNKGKIEVIGIARDITERKELEKAIRVSEERYRKQFEKAMDAIFVAEAETGILVDCNRAATELVGRKKSEIIGKHQRILHPPEKIEDEFSKTYKQHIKEKEGQVLEDQIITKDGEIRDITIKANIFELGDKRLLHGIFRDITGQKKAEQALKASAKRFRELSELLPEVVFEADTTGRLTFANQAAFERFGYSREDFEKGLNALQMITLEDQDRSRENIAQILSGEVIGSNEYIAIRKDGTTFPVLIHSTPIIRGKKPVGIRGVIIDITERKQAEEAVEKIVNDLSTMIEKLGVVGRLTRHDARNKLSVIANNAYLAKQLLANNRNAAEYLDSIESAVEQIEKIFDFTRTYEMLGAEELSHIDVEKSVNEAVRLFTDINKCKIINECHGLTVLADSLLRQLIYNLIDNSLKHGETANQIKVYYQEGRDQLKLIYEDNGLGIPKDEKEKIFMEGYGKGTGYGLYLIRKICEAYGWIIQETGIPGKGAQFTIAIPKTNKNGEIAYQVDKK